jgi:hypothetical protein
LKLSAVGGITNANAGTGRPSEAETAMGESRQFVDSFGFSWQVIEIVREITRDSAPPTVDRWLYFLSRGTTRRLRAYPLDWASKAWSDFEDLCTLAEVVGTDAGSQPVRAFSERFRAAPVG